MYLLNGVSPSRFVRDLKSSIADDNIFNGAAALAFYLTLSIFPAMIFLMAVLPYLPVQRIDQAIMDLLRQALPSDAATLFADVVAEVTRERRGGLLSFGFLAALWAASTGMYAIMQQLNITYHVKEARSFVRARAVALGLTLLFGLLVVGSLSLIVTGGALQEWIGNRFGTSEALLMAFSVFRWAMIVLALLLAFALIYYLAPNVEQRFVFITPGSVLATALLVIASLGFSLYASRFGNYDATYGSIGAVILLMLWLYIAGLVILVGSEVNVLVETYAPEGKVKGERVEGEATADNVHPLNRPSDGTRANGRARHAPSMVTERGSR
jgi:membrane protein